MLFVGSKRSVDVKQRTKIPILDEARGIAGKAELVYQLNLESAGKPVTQNAGGNPHVDIAGLGLGGCMPNHNGLRCGNLVRHRDIRSGIGKWLDLLSRNIVCSGERPKQGIDKRLNLCRIEVTGDDKGRIIGNVERSKEVLNVLHRGSRKVFMRTDYRGRVRVPLREHQRVDSLIGPAVWSVFRVLSSLILYDIALKIKLLLGHRLPEVFESVSVEPKESWK